MEGDGKVVSDGKEVVIKVPPVEEWPLKSLRYTCKRNKVKGYTKMSREELIGAVKEVIANMKNNTQP